MVRARTRHAVPLLISFNAPTWFSNQKTCLCLRLLNPCFETGHINGFRKYQKTLETCAQLRATSSTPVRAREHSNDTCECTWSLATQRPLPHSVEHVHRTHAFVFAPKRELYLPHAAVSARRNDTFRNARESARGHLHVETHDAPTLKCC